MKLYKILKDGKITESPIPGTFAGYKKGKIFGNLECKSGMRMKKENRVFFHSMEDAISEGYRPCKNCKPMNEKDFEKYKQIIPYNSLEEFYNRDKNLSLKK